MRAVVEPHDPDGALFAYALAGEPARSRLERYFADFRQVGLEISGDDLARLGLQESPRVGAILDELLRRKLNGGARWPGVGDRGGEGAHRRSRGARVRLFEPDLGDAYFAAFSTRQGGVSEGDFESSEPRHPHGRRARQGRREPAHSGQSRRRRPGDGDDGLAGPRLARLRGGRPGCRHARHRLRAGRRPLDGEAGPRRSASSPRTASPSSSPAGTGLRGSSSSTSAGAGSWKASWRTALLR